MSAEENPTANQEPLRQELTANVSPPRDDAAGDHANAAQPHVSSPSELYAKLEYLSGLSLTGIVPVARINASHSCLRTLLHYLKDNSVPGKNIADADALKILRDDPQLLRMLQPLLTPEQLAMIVAEAPRD